MKKDILIYVAAFVLFVALFTAVPHYLGVVVFVHTLTVIIGLSVILYGVYIHKEDKRQEERQKELFKNLYK
jgi:4-hydroxybenzoate polyprenyltransferase